MLAACSDDDGDGSGGGNAEISIPASIVDGMQIASVTTSDTENALSIDYNDDGTPASATVGGQVFDFEYEPVTRAAQPTGRKLVHVVPVAVTGRGWLRILHSIPTASWPRIKRS